MISAPTAQVSTPAADPGLVLIPVLIPDSDPGVIPGLFVTVLVVSGFGTII